jgi:hypothetical protein
MWGRGPAQRKKHLKKKKKSFSVKNFTHLPNSRPLHIFKSAQKNSTSFDTLYAQF